VSKKAVFNLLPIRSAFFALSGFFFSHALKRTIVPLKNCIIPQSAVKKPASTKSCISYPKIKTLTGHVARSAFTKERTCFI
jgi:hypothetical protein